MSGEQTLRDRVLGTREFLGWWTLPVFVMVGLAGAVIAGALTTVYYSQQVDALQDETAEGRAELRTAVEDVQNAGQDALDAIEGEVEQVRETLTRELPFEDVTTVGVVALRSTVGGNRSAPQQQPAPGGSGQPNGAAFAQEQQPQQTQQPGQQQTQQPDQQQTQPPQPAQTAPPAPPPPTEERVTSGFAVAFDGTTTFIATSYALIADPNAPGGIVPQVEVITPRGTVTGATHSWDAGRDLALIRAEIGEVELMSWRPSSEELAVGERVIAAGVTPTLNTVQIPGQLAFVDVTALVTDLPVVDFLRGAPIVDGKGHVIGLVSGDYQPFGSAAGDRQAMVPVQLLCERMLRNCAALEADPDEEPADEG